MEQILPTLATKSDLAEAIAPLATKAELAKAIAPLATKAELREESERTRRHMDVVAERPESQIRLLAESQVGIQEQMRDLRTALKTDITRLDRRVMRLEVDRKG